MILVYITIYLVIGWFIISIMNFALDGPNAEFDDPMMILLIVGWPFTVAISILFVVCIGAYEVAKFIGVTIYKIWN